MPDIVWEGLIVKRNFLHARFSGGLTAVAFGLLLTAGCLGVSQTSMKIYETGTTYRFAAPRDAVEAYSTTNGLVLKVPVTVWEKKYSWVRGGLMMCVIGGHRYIQTHQLTDEFVYLQSTRSDTSSRFELLVPARTNLVCAAARIKVPCWVRDIANFDFSIDAEPADMRPAMPLISEKTAPYHGLFVGLAVIDGIVVDVPLSIVETIFCPFLIPLGQSY